MSKSYRSLQLSLLSFLLLLPLLLSGCLEETPPVGTIEINRDLPELSSGLLHIGVTLNPGTTTGRDLLSGNLLVNGSFDLAPRLAVSLHASDTTVTTPNGYRQFYPLPEHIYGWRRSDDQKTEVLRDKLREEEGGSFYLRASGLRGDTVRMLYHLKPFAVKAGDRFTLTAKLRGGHSRVTAAFVRDSVGGEIVSETRSFIASEAWRAVEGTVALRQAADSVYLQLTFESYDGAIDSDTIPASFRRNTGNAFADIDDLFLSREGEGSLDSLLSALRPYYIRYPDGLTSGGFYPGTFPLHDTIPHEKVPVWTSTGYEYTGLFSLENFLSLASETGAQPILLENAGITNEDAGRRYEDVALVPERVRYYERVLRRASTDSLLLQIGYNMPPFDYPKRFGDMVKLFEKDTVTPFLISGGLLASPEGEAYSDYVADYVLPPLSTPDFIEFVPEGLRRTFTQTQPIMLGEVHFADSGDEGQYLPSFLLRAAFLIEAEKYAEALKGLSLYPLLSEDSDEAPLILVRDNSFISTPLYHFCRAFPDFSGREIRSLDYKGLKDAGLYASLTSDPEGENFYLKAANTTRHPLTYRLKDIGTGTEPLRHLRILRFSPVGLSPEAPPAKGLSYRFSEEEREFPFGRETSLTIGAYEAVLLHLY